mgnify:CR=1 FL=1
MLKLLVRSTPASVGCRRFAPGLQQQNIVLRKFGVRPNVFDAALVMVAQLVKPQAVGGRVSAAAQHRQANCLERTGVAVFAGLDLGRVSACKAAVHLVCHRLCFGAQLRCQGDKLAAAGFSVKERTLRDAAQLGEMFFRQFDQRGGDVGGVRREKARSIIWNCRGNGTQQCALFLYIVIGL